MNKEFITKAVGALLSVAGIVTLGIGGLIFGCDEIGIEKVTVHKQPDEEK